jgi:hypothetical protein
VAQLQVGTTVATTLSGTPLQTSAAAAAVGAQVYTATATNLAGSTITYTGTVSATRADFAEVL